ncbi:MAG: hypothetical protein ABI435_01460 [Pseudolysinimonas sp.]
MAVVSISRFHTAAAGAAFLVAGVLLVVMLVVESASVHVFFSWPTVLAYLAIGIGFAILATGSVSNLAARAVLLIGAVGWVLLAVQTVARLPLGLNTLAWILAVVGGIAGAVLLLTARLVARRAATAFLATTVAVTLQWLLLFSAIAVPLAAIVAVGFLVTGALLVATPRTP